MGLGGCIQGTQSAMAYLTYVLRDRCNPEPAVKVRDPTVSSGR